jgi:hypothetical protein
MSGMSDMWHMTGTTACRRREQCGFADDSGVKLKMRYHMAGIST